jgi:hypothetical protein
MFLLDRLNHTMAEKKDLTEGLTEKFHNQEDCDVMFKVDDKRIGAHKLVLAVKSPVLHEMSSGWNRGKEPIGIEGMDFMSFKALLRLIC